MELSNIVCKFLIVLITLHSNGAVCRLIANVQWIEVNAAENVLLGTFRVSYKLH